MSDSLMVTPLVERTARRIAVVLESREFGVEEPLPTRRQWAKELMVSHFTVGKAMEVLRRQGVIESTEGSYTFLKAGNRPRHEQPHPDMELSLWFNTQHNVRRARQAIVRKRFQKNFVADKPGLRFSEQHFAMPMTEFFAQMFLSFVRGHGPVIAEFPQTYLDFLSSHGALATFPVEDGQDYLDLMEPRFLDHSMTGESCQFLPFVCTYSFLVCNRELMLKSGIDPEESFDSWKDFTEKSGRLRDALGVEPLHMSEENLLWLLTHWIYQADSTLPDGGRMPMVDWESEAAREGMDFLLDMVFEHRLIRVEKYNDQLSLASPLWAGRVPMALGDSMLATAVELGRASDFTIKALPSRKNGVPFSLMNVAGWTVSAQADKATQRRAWQYILAWENWLHLGEGGESMRRLGVAPGLCSLFKDPGQDRFHSGKVPEDWRRVFQEIRGVARWEAPDSGMMRQVLSPLLRSELQKNRRPDTRTLLTHLMLAQHDAGILISPH